MIIRPIRLVNAVLCLFALFCIASHHVTHASMYWTYIAGALRNNVGKFNLPAFTTTSDDENYIPGSRDSAMSWLSSSGTSLYIFGGFGFGRDGKGYLQDLWRFDVDTRYWTWMSKTASYGFDQLGNYGVGNVAHPDNIPGGRWKAATWRDDDDGLWMFGGYGYATQNVQGHLRDLWYFRQSDQNWIPQNFAGTSSLSINQKGDYTMPSTINTIPGARLGAVTWRVGSQFYLFGGFGFDGEGNSGYLNDLWYFDVSTKQWNFVTGSPTVNVNGVYAIQGVAYSSTVSYPGGRMSGASWISNAQELYLFGGTGRGSASVEGRLNDMWKYNIDRDEWTWVSGQSSVNGLPDYGTQGVPEFTNLPGSRTELSFTQRDDDLDIFYLFGGTSTDYQGGNGLHNDLWEYNVATSMWTWLSGSNYRTQGGDYNIRGSPSLTSVPGTRRAASVWFTNGTFIVFGGFGKEVVVTGSLADVWIYDETYSCAQVLYTNPAVCSTHGTCDMPEVCTCEAGYDGDICEHSICFGTLSSDGSVCTARGTCVSPDTCSCNTGYAGEECELFVCYDVYSNESSVCSSHGTCEAPNSCSCSTGYTGNNCEHSICFGVSSDLSNTCSSHGTCYAPNSCLCTNEFGGPNCEFSYCFGVLSNESTTCSTHGACVSPDTCSCSTGYAGSNCELTECYGYLSNQTEICSSHGVCQHPDDCDCASGYDGNECQWSICNGYLSSDTANVCSGYGTCVAPATCVCNEGHAGANCELYDCFGTLSNETSVCTTHGSCTFVDQCDCASGYDGAECELSICHGFLSNDTANVCSGYGTCTAPATCVCDTGHDGTTCELFNCFGTLSNQASVCTGHGACTFVDQCECSSGYNGTICELIDCFGYLSDDTDNVCSGKGVCTLPDTCSCSSGYHGDECELVECFTYLSNDANVCSSHGDCIAPNVCTCADGHHGAQCDVTECFGFLSNDTANVCSNHGTCVALQNCACVPNYFGDTCNLPQCYGFLSNDSQVCFSRGVCSAPNTCDCSSGYHGNECEMVDCYGLMDTNPNVCSAHGVCLLPHNCTCNNNYWGDQCEEWSCYGELRTNSTVCSAHGSCTAHDNCVCTSGYSQALCDEYDCFGLVNFHPAVCSSHGTCEAVDSCVCLTNYSGADCSTHFCYGTRNDDSAVCSSHGTCDAYDMCNCATGYYGDDCGLYECFGVLFSDNDTVCNGGEGTCVAPDICVCSASSLFYGPTCSNFSCFTVDSTNGAVCGSNGVCETHDVCNCTSGWIGEQCQYAVCFGLNSTDPTVCHGNGDCIDVDTCVCQGHRFSPPECEDFGDFCFNVSALLTPELTCSSHGECIGWDNCSCVEGYFSDDCSLWACNNTVYTDDSVCSSHGSCVSYDNCTCTQDYYGPVCESHDCFGIHFEQSSVCTAHGVCSQPDTCACQSGYESDDCSTWKCFGVDSRESSVCSSKGACTAPDTCSCLSGYSGPSCSEWDVSIVPNAGYAFRTSFRIVFPPDIVVSSAQFNVTFVHPITSETLNPLMDPYQKNVFNMDIEGSSLLSYQVPLSIHVVMENATLSATRTITVYPVTQYCNADISSPPCSPVLSNFSSYHLRDSSTTSMDDVFRFIESPVDAFYDCNGWRSATNADCPTLSVVYSKVSCRFPSSSFGFCETARKICNCHPSYTGLDCSVLKEDLPGMQLFQMQIISSLNSIISRTGASEEYIRRDLSITQCILNDLHDITFSFLDAAMEHLTRLYAEISTSNSAALAANSEQILEISSRLLDMLYLKEIAVNQEKILLIPRISTLVHNIVKHYFGHVSQGLISTLSSPRISAYLLDDLRSSFADKEIEHESAKLVFPTKPIAPQLSRMQVAFVVFDYDLYAPVSPHSNITSGIYSVKFFDSLGTEYKVSNLPTGNEFEIHIPGEWNINVEHELGYSTDACRFWDTGVLEWSTVGCVLSELTETTAVCSCNHATDFGLTNINIFDIPPIPGQFDWMLLAIIGGSSLAALISLCCICCLVCCMCLCCALMLAAATKLRKLKIPKIGGRRKRRSGTDLDIYEPEPDEHSGSKLLPHDMDWQSLDSIGGPYRPAALDDDTSIIPELRDQLRLLGNSQNPEEVEKLKTKIAELKDKHRRRKELDEMKTHMTSLMAIKPLLDEKVAEHHLQQLEQRMKQSSSSRKQRRVRSPTNKPQYASPESPYTEDHDESPIRRRAPLSPDKSPIRARLPSRYVPEIDIPNPVIKEQVEEYRREKEIRTEKYRPAEREFQRWEEQINLEPEPENHHIERIEKQIHRNNEQINELKRESRSFTSPKDPRRQHTSEAIIKLKFENKMLQKKIHEYAQKYGQNPDRLKLKRQIDNLRKQFHNNKEIIHNLELQLDSEVQRLAASPIKMKSPAISRLAMQIEKIEVDNALLIKKGNTLMSEFFELNRRQREWVPGSPQSPASPVRAPVVHDYYSALSKEPIRTEDAKLHHPPLRTAPTPPTPVGREPVTRESDAGHSALMNRMLATDTQTNTLFSEYSTNTSSMSEVSRTIRDKLERLKNRMAETRRRFKENQHEIQRIKMSGRVDQGTIGKLELENRLLVENIARMAKKYRELSNQIKRRKA